MNIMIVVPHPDDEVLGFGGIIQRHIKNGDSVLIYFLTEINNRIPSDQARLKKQLEQSLSVGKLLGYESISSEVMLDDAHFISNTNILSEKIERFKPDILYTTFPGDNNQDHKYIFNIVRVSTRIWASFLVKKIYIGEILSSTNQTPTLPQSIFSPNYYVPLTENEVQTKIEAMKLYTGEIRQWPHPRSEHGIKVLAEKRGSECYNAYAESFMILRYIEKS